MPLISGKGNRTRKTLSFFGVNFGLNPPYSVLCDGPVIFHSLKNDLYLKQSLPKLLGAPAYPAVTECVVKELRRLGDDFTNAALFAKRVKRVPCVHDGKVDVAECLLSCLRNPSHTGSILATNDPEVSKKAMRVPGVAIVSILNQKKLVLQAPSLATTSYVKRSQKTKIHNLSDPDRALVQEIKATEDSLRKDRVVRIKRKRAKGPNPLSVKKSKEIGKRNVDGTLGATAMLEMPPPDKDSRDDKTDEATAEFEEREGVPNTAPHENNGSPDVASGEGGRKRKRRRATKPRTERDPGSDRAGKGIEKIRLPQREDRSSAPGLRNIKQQSKQVGEQQSAMEVAIADDIGLSTCKFSSVQQDQGAPPPALNNTGTDEHQCVQQLPSATQAREQTPPKNDEASVLTNTHSDLERCQEKKGNKVSFNESMPNANGGTSASGQIAEPLPPTSRDGVESKDDSGAPQCNHPDTNDSQLIAMDRTGAEEELAEKCPQPTPSGERTKKHRKNRRRRPKKKTSE